MFQKQESKSLKIALRHKVFTSQQKSRRKFHKRSKLKARHISKAGRLKGRDRDYERDRDQDNSASCSCGGFDWDQKRPVSHGTATITVTVMARSLSLSLSWQGHNHCHCHCHGTVTVMVTVFCHVYLHANFPTEKRQFDGVMHKDVRPCMVCMCVYVIRT